MLGAEGQRERAHYGSTESEGAEALCMEAAAWFWTGILGLGVASMEVGGNSSREAAELAQGGCAWPGEMRVWIRTQNQALILEEEDESTKRIKMRMTREKGNPKQRVYEWTDAPPRQRFPHTCPNTSSRQSVRIGVSQTPRQVMYQKLYSQDMRDFYQNLITNKCKARVSKLTPRCRHIRLPDHSAVMFAINDRKTTKQTLPTSANSQYTEK